MPSLRSSVQADARHVPPVALVKAVRTLPILAPADWVPLTGGRVNRSWHVGDAVVKLYDRAQASPLFPNNAEAEAQALTALAPAGLAPWLLGQGNGWIAYRYLAGPTWAGEGETRRPRSDACGGGGFDTPGAVAQLLGCLHRHPVERLPFRTLPSGAWALLEQGRLILAACTGTLPAPPSVADPGPVGTRVLLHGDAVPGNIIVGPAGLTLIDWQCPALGDPAEDLAAFLSPAMQWLYRGSPLTRAEATAFLDACADRSAVARYHALAPLFRWRMAAHCLWRAERGEPDYARALEVELET